MRKLILGLFLLAMIFSTSLVRAQFNPYTDQTKMVTAGIGFSGWGIPIFGRFEIGVAENISVGGGISWQGYNETYTGVKWHHSIFGITGRGSYHFNELIELPDEWDLYAGLGIGFLFTSSTYKGTATPFDYDGSVPSDFFIDIHVGGRYFINDKIGVNLELGGGTGLSGGSIGVTFLL